MATGSVTVLGRWPVKSFGGEMATALRLDDRGIAGDRAHALLHHHKGERRRLTAREAPAMLRWRAVYADAPDDALHPGDVPAPRITAPDGTTWAWDDPALPAALSADLGRDVMLHRDDALQQDLSDSILVTTQATLAAVSQALGRDLDLRRFRTNVHVVLDARPFAEHAWEGRRLRVGDVVLDLLHPCERCVIPTRDPDTVDKSPELLRWLSRHQGGLFGINARSTGPGRIAVGDPVQLL